MQEGVARHDQRVAPFAHRKLDSGVHPGLQARVIVGDLDLHFRRPGCRVEHRRDAGDAPAEALARVGIDLHAAMDPVRHAPQILLDEVRHESHRGDVDNGHDRRRGGDPGTRIEEPLADVAVDRRRDHRVGQRNLQLIEPGLGLGELRARKIELGRRRLEPSLRIVHRLPGQQLPVEQAPGPVEIRLGELQIGLALPNGGGRDLMGRLGLPDLLANLEVLDAREGLAPRDAVAKFHGDALQPAVDLWDDLDRSRANQVSHDGEVFGDRLGPGGL